jgi:hypothetical protein
MDPAFSTVLGHCRDKAEAAGFDRESTLNASPSKNRRMHFEYPAAAAEIIQRKYVADTLAELASTHFA